MNCTYCGSTRTVKNGNRRLLNTWKQRFLCRECNRIFTPQQETVMDEKYVKEGPKILILDIETAPMTVFAFQLKTDYISPDNIITPTYVICWAAKWIGDSHIMGDVVTSKEAKNQDDKRVCESIHTLLSQADLVVAFNGDRFDFKKLNYRFIVNDMYPPSEYRTIDPIVSLRSQFGFDSNRLDHTNAMFGLETKLHTDFNLWKKCFSGDNIALNTMLVYNKQDVNILEQHYMRIRPWMKRHPNLGIYFEWEGEMCRICGSKNVREVLDKFHYTNLGKYSLYHCTDCGAESQGRSNELEKDKRKSLIK